MYRRLHGRAFSRGLCPWLLNCGSLHADVSVENQYCAPFSIFRRRKNWNNFAQMQLPKTSISILQHVFVVDVLIVATLYFLCCWPPRKQRTFPCNCVKSSIFWRPLGVFKSMKPLPPNFVFFLQWDGHSMIHLSSNSISVKVIVYSERRSVLESGVFLFKEVCMGIRQGLIHT